MFIILFKYISNINIFILFNIMNIYIYIFNYNISGIPPYLQITCLKYINFIGDISLQRDRKLF